MIAGIIEDNFTFRRNGHELLWPKTNEKGGMFTIASRSSFDIEPLSNANLYIFWAYGKIK